MTPLHRGTGDMIQLKSMGSKSLPNFPYQPNILQHTIAYKHGAAGLSLPLSLCIKQRATDDEHIKSMGQELAS